MINGPAGAAILAGGMGCFILGFIAAAADISKSAASWLNFYKPTGPLSGVTSLSIFLWLLTWLTLARCWRKKMVALGKVNAVAFALLGMGLLLTFPPFVDYLSGR